MNVINQPIGATIKFNAIAKINKYGRLCEGHQFIPLAMEVHGAPKHDMDHFIEECAHLFHDRQSKGHLFLFFYIQFFFTTCWYYFEQHVLAITIKKKLHWRKMFVLNLLLLLNFMICM